MDISSFLSGAAIAGVVLFLTGFLKKAGEEFYCWSKKKMYPKTAERIGNPISEQIGMVTYDEILTTIENAPPLQREQVSKNFDGLKIEWDTLFFTGKLSNDNYTLLLTIPDSRRHGIVWCNVPASEYRELGILPEKSRIRVTGKIQIFADSKIWIADAKLHILGKPN